LIDNIVPEPLGGAHRDPNIVAQNLKEQLIEKIDALEKMPMEKLLEDRYQRLMQYGRFVEAEPKS